MFEEQPPLVVTFHPADLRNYGEPKARCMLVGYQKDSEIDLYADFKTFETQGRIKMEGFVQDPNQEFSKGGEYSMPIPVDNPSDRYRYCLWGLLKEMGIEILKKSNDQIPTIGEISVPTVLDAVANELGLISWKLIYD